MREWVSLRAAERSAGSLSYSMAAAVKHKGRQRNSRPEGGDEACAVDGAGNSPGETMLMGIARGDEDSVERNGVRQR